MFRYIVPYGWVGIIIIAAAEWLLFQRNSFVSLWCTPLMWTGYIIAADNFVYKRSGNSMLVKSRLQILLIGIISILSWLIFEGYNILLQNWHYVNLPDAIWVRYAGYGWSFATITPGIFVTYDVLWSFAVFNTAKIRQLTISKNTLMIIMLVSGVLSLYPFIVPNKYLFPLVWVSIIFFIDPIVYYLGGKSLFKDLMEGNPQTVYRLLLAGFICGILWEFWNYWAVTKWIYTVPYFPNYKLFEMPLVGFLGFPPFAVECYVLYQLAKIILEKAGIKLAY